MDKPTDDETPDSGLSAEEESGLDEVVSDTQAMELCEMVTGYSRERLIEQRREKALEAAAQVCQNTNWRSAGSIVEFAEIFEEYLRGDGTDSGSDS